MSGQSKIDDLGKLVEGQRFAMLTTKAGDKLVSRPMTIQETENGVLRFITQADNDVARESDGQQVNLAIVDGGTYISLSGVGHLENDVTKKQELWNRLNEAYAGEPEDPNNVILDIAVESGEYWDGGNPVAQVLNIAKTAITGKAPQGEHGTVEL